LVAFIRVENSPRGSRRKDFRNLVSEAEKYGIEVAKDLALQCTPDHLYAKDRPEWFCLRPEGTVEYAENPPKKYEDIYLFDFETLQWLLKGTSFPGRWKNLDCFLRSILSKARSMSYVMNSTIGPIRVNVPLQGIHEIVGGQE